jgi:hypothetical protein
MVQSGTRRYQEQRKELARNQKEKLWEDGRDWRLSVHKPLQKKKLYRNKNNIYPLQSSNIIK